ncbi:Peroxisomal membrane protein 2 [Seminavis robusta]|uniref:Peroxisomal membrane protein 2 n=1 Tax=Seminavis robusta TaxID=568900 RepID=A0A9N8E607_9STRA|nr:Peroxisomal membrane protein 2 [Seminavis robusta]|eukprot:Sro535_g161880.1 Peroxisomal membrane protein 2 (306) ;mRNA; f:4968-5885
MVSRRISSAISLCFAILISAAEGTTSSIHGTTAESDSLLVLEPLVCSSKVFDLSTSNGTTFSPSNATFVCTHDDAEAPRIRTLLGQVGSWYSASLESNPILTKATTAAAMGACGDIFAQMVEAWSVGFVFHWSDLHLRRIFAVAAEGMFISGPLMHLSYELLEQHFPVFADDEADTNSTEYSSWFMVLCQVLVDAIVMDSVFVATVIAATAVLEGRGRDLINELKATYIAAVKASWISSLCWSPVQLLSFKYVPLQFRVAAVNLQDIAWTATISFVAHRCHNQHRTIISQTKCQTDKQAEQDRKR